MVGLIALGGLERALGRKTYELDLAGGGSVAGLGVNERIARALIAKGHRPAVVTRVLQVSRQSIYCPISRHPVGAGPERGRPGDESIIKVAKPNPTDGTRMVAELGSRELGEAVNRKRVQRVMREHRLLQRTRNTDRRRRPGYFRVTRPDELWRLDMTKAWTAAHGWVNLHVASVPRTRRVESIDASRRRTRAAGGGGPGAGRTLRGTQLSRGN